MRKLNFYSFLVFVSIFFIQCHSTPKETFNSSLALAYAETHPMRVTDMVFRGVFTDTKEKIDHFYYGGTRLIFSKSSIIQSSKEWYWTERQLTFGKSIDIEPQWSPDGRKLSFASFRNESWDVWIIDLSGRDSTQVTTNLKYVQSTTWSPDGHWIALAASRDYNFGFTGNIYKKNLAEGGSLRRVTSGPVDGSPNWSPDGKYIIYTSNRSHNWEIWKVKVKSGKEEQLTETRVANLAPKWSPDGKKIAFHSTRSGGGDIYTMNEDGKDLKRITTSDAFDHYPTWSPDGKYIAFQSDRSGNFDIWVIPAAGGKAVQLTDNPADDRRPAWSPDGTKIAFTSDRSGNDDIWILE